MSDWKLDGGDPEARVMGWIGKVIGATSPKHAQESAASTELPAADSRANMVEGTMVKLREGNIGSRMKACHAILE